MLRWMWIAKSSSHVGYEELDTKLGIEDLEAAMVVSDWVSDWVSTAATINNKWKDSTEITNLSWKTFYVTCDLINLCFFFIIIPLRPKVKVQKGYGRASIDRQPVLVLHLCHCFISSHTCLSFSFSNIQSSSLSTPTSDFSQLFSTPPLPSQWQSRQKRHISGAADGGSCRTLAWHCQKSFSPLPTNDHELCRTWCSVSFFSNPFRHFHFQSVFPFPRCCAYHTYFLKFHQELASLSVDVEVDYIHFNTIKLKAEITLTTLSAQIPS